MALSINGRFFEKDDQPFYVKAVTYGPFPPDNLPYHAIELNRIAQAGFNTIRTYEKPDSSLLDLAAEHNLIIIPTIPWDWDSLFTENPETLLSAKDELTLFLSQYGKHRALGALILANEIRPDLARFMGPVRVREILEELITHCQEQAPLLPIAYASFPTTEYLEPRNADFTAFNVYLEKQEDFAKYLRRLHNIAGDRPLLLSEFGYNTFREGYSEQSHPDLEKLQTEMLSWAYQTAQQEWAAGFTVYAWSDLWFNGGVEVQDWSFGLTRRDGSAKPALSALSPLMSKGRPPLDKPPLFTIAICTRNGGHRLKENLPFFEKIDDPHYELLVVDDGSTDDTSLIVQDFLTNCTLTGRLLHQDPSGLSAARNHAAREGRGEFIVYIDDDARPHPYWLEALRSAFARNPKAAAAGGPNLAPVPHSYQNAIVTACSGNASHILFTDTTAEHLPGCNFALKRELLLEIEGFDKRYHTAGDDVDVCWRLLDAGYQLAFHPAACIFHDRRGTIRQFLRQQRGYGQAEALLYQKHPARFGPDGIRWEGFIYSGAPLSADHDSVIYHGPMGEAPYQMLQLTHMPVRPLARNYRSKLNEFVVRGVNWLARQQRRETRKEHGGPAGSWQAPEPNHQEPDKETRLDFPLNENNTRKRLLAQLQEQGWTVAHDDSQADLQRGPIQLLTAETVHAKENVTLHLKIIHPPVEIEPVKEELTAIAQKDT